MKRNYNVLYRDSNVNIERKNKRTFWGIATLLAFALISQSGIAQTTLLSPTGDGGFETGNTFALNGWTVANPAANAFWEVGTAAGQFAGNRGAYVVSSTGVYSYNTGTTRVTHLYRDLSIPAGATAITLSFQWKGKGQSGFDRGLVYTAPTSVTPSNNNLPAAAATLVWTQPTVQTTLAYTTATVNLPSTLAGTTVRLIFTWQNDNSGGTTPGIAVDNIELVYTPAPGCTGTPNAGTAFISATTGCSGDAITLSSSGLSAGTGISYLWQSSPDGSSWTNITGASSGTYPTTGPVGTTYYRISTTCASSTSYSSAVSFTGSVCGSYNFPVTGVGTSVSCGSSTYLYDSAGSGANYVINSDAYVVLQNSGTGVITITGTYATESCCDYIAFYSGVGTGSTALASYYGSGTITPLTSTPGETITVRFVSDFSINGAGFALRVLYSGTCASCSASPSALNASSVTPTSATVSWTAPSPVPTVGYQYAVTTSATPPGSGTATTATSVAVNSLTANTDYYLHVRAVCTGPLYSPWVTYAFSTPCSPITTLPSTEGFEADAPCWQAIPITGTGNWGLYTAINTEVPGPHAGAAFAGIAWDGTVTTSALLISPPYNISANGNVESRVKVWIYRGTSGNTSNRITVRVHTSPTTGGTQILDIPRNITQAPAVASAGWYQYTASVPVTFNPSTFYITAQSFVGTGNGQYSVGLDDFTLEFSPPVVSSFAPLGVCASGTNAERTITINGTSFIGATAVTVNGTAVQSFTVNSAIQITAVVSASATSGTIAVNGPGGTGTSTGTLAINTNVAITSATAGASPICPSSTTTLTANGVVGTNAVVTWFTGTGGTGTNLGTGSTITAGPGTYYARVTGTCGGPVEAAPVTVGAKVNVSVGTPTAAANPICSTATTTLTANGVAGTNAVVTWFTGAGGTGTNLGTGTTLFPVGPGTYYSRVTGDCGAVEASVTVGAKINVAIGSATTGTGSICEGTTTTVTANGVAGTNAVVNWYTGSGATGTNVGTGTTITVSPGTYYAYVTGDCGTPAQASVTVTGLANTAIVSATAAAGSICQDATTTLTANGVTGTNTEVYWFTESGAGGDLVDSGTAITVGPGTYYAYVTGDCGGDVEAGPVTVVALADTSIATATAADSSICQDATTTVTANGVAGSNTTVTWYTGSGGTGTNLGTGTTLSVGPGTYYAYVTGDCGVAEASVTVGTLADTAIASATAAASPICQDATTTVTANGVAGTNTVVTWYTGSGATGSNAGTGTTITVGPGTYYAYVTGDCGPAAEASVTVGAKTDVSVDSATAASPTICDDATTTVTANGVAGDNAVVTWYTGSGATGTNVGTGTTITVGPGTYYAYVTGDCGPADEASVTVTGSPNVTYYTDADGDGFGNPAAPVTSCSGAPIVGGFVAVLDNTDCNDANGAMHTTYPLYTDNDGDGYGSGTTTSLQCAVNAATAPAGFSVNNTDCDDSPTGQTINPGASEVLYDGVDNNCNNQLDEGFQLKTKLLPSVCGTTLASIGSLIGITTVSSAITGYRIRSTNGAQVQVIERTVPHFTLANFPSYAYATTYTIEIELQRNGIWLGYYGDPCLVSSPAVLTETGATQVVASQCGITLPRINTLIATTSLSGVTGYRFQVTNITAGASGPNVVQTIDRTLHWFNLQMLTQYNYGSTYRIEVAIKTTGTSYSGFGSPCEVSSPPAPTLINCGGTVASASTLVAATSLQGVTQYRFQVKRVSDGATTGIDRTQNYFTFNSVPGYTPGAAYDVRVAVMTVGTWSPFGDICTITSPGSARFIQQPAPADPTTSFKAVAYPNPFASSFAIDVTSSASSPVQLKVYDMTGRLIESREANTSDLNMLQVGDRYPSGVYNVIVAQGENIETLRVIKR